MKISEILFNPGWTNKVQLEDPSVFAVYYVYMKDIKHPHIAIKVSLHKDGTIKVLETQNSRLIFTGVDESELIEKVRVFLTSKQ